MKTQFNLKDTTGALLQWLGALVGFILCLVIPNLLLPLPKEIMVAVPASGILATPIAFLISGGVNALILVWAARERTRSREVPASTGRTAIDPHK